MDRVKDKTCIVTGAARGMGHAIGMALMREGANVVFADIDENICQVAAEATKKGGSAHGIQVDIRDRQQVQAMVDETVKKFGKLDVKFNNAGTCEIQNTLTMSPH